MFLHIHRSFQLFYLSINNFTTSITRSPKPTIDGVIFQNLSQRLSGSVGSFLFKIILQRLRNVAEIKSQTYSQ